MFGPKRDENGEWRRLHNEELHSLPWSRNIVRVIKYRRFENINKDDTNKENEYLGR